MPILGLVDVSLSMLAPMDTGPTQASGGDGSNRRTAAIGGVSAFLDYLDSHNRQEFVSLAAFSDDLDVTDFTKDYPSLKETLSKSGAYEVRSKTSIVEALRGAFYRCVAVWGSNVLCHVVLVTDCSGCNPDFERLINSVALLEGKEIVEKSNFWKSSQDDGQSASISVHTSPVAQEFYQLIGRGAFTFHVICVNNSNTTDHLVQQNVRIYKKLIEFFDNGGTFRFIEPGTTNPTLTFRKLAEELSANSASTLQCGTFVASIDVVPALKPMRKEDDFDVINSKLGDSITIVGFLRPVELGSPPITSRHLLLATRKAANTENVDPTKHKPLDEDKNPNFCVLLHGAMKVEDMAAICEIGQNWYGYIYHLPVAKKSNLVLHCFEPGINAVPWLGPLNKLNLRPFVGAAGATTAKSPFPIASKSKPSYAMTNPNWIHSYGLQADVQKVLRYARKLPEKELQFHQELSRVCNEALTLGFTELFTIMARLFEKELVTAGANGPQAPGLKSAISILLSGRLKFGDPISQFGK